jgi:hypothetical protein
MEVADEDVVVRLKPAFWAAAKIRLASRSASG